MKKVFALVIVALFAAPAMAGQVQISLASDVASIDQALLPATAHIAVNINSAVAFGGANFDIAANRAGGQFTGRTLGMGFVAADMNAVTFPIAVGPNGADLGGAHIGSPENPAGQGTMETFDLLLPAGLELGLYTLTPVAGPFGFVWASSEVPEIYGGDFEPEDVSGVSIEITPEPAALALLALGALALRRR